MEQTSGSHVLTCLADQCSYNCREVCCAPVIEVGEEHPACDTFTTGAVQIADFEPQVQDCKVSQCHFNSSWACTAAGVTMITHSDHADCATFRM